MHFLEESGFEVTILPVDEKGVVSLEALEKALRPDTILVSVMFVNNEIGSVQPIDAIGKMVHEKAPKALFHVDAIQAFGKFQIYPKKLGIDLMSVSAHKIHGPKGVGFLYISEKAKVQPQILGAVSKAGCAPEQIMCRELQEWQKPPGLCMNIWKKTGNICIR